MSDMEDLAGSPKGKFCISGKCYKKKATFNKAIAAALRAGKTVKLHMGGKKASKAASKATGKKGGRKSARKTRKGSSGRAATPFIRLQKAVSAAKKATSCSAASKALASAVHAANEMKTSAHVRKRMAEVAQAKAAVCGRGGNAGPSNRGGNRASGNAPPGWSSDSRRAAADGGARYARGGAWSASNRRA